MVEEAMWVSWTNERRRAQHEARERCRRRRKTWDTSQDGWRGESKRVVTRLLAEGGRVSKDGASAPRTTYLDHPDYPASIADIQRARQPTVSSRKS